LAQGARRHLAAPMMLFLYLSVATAWKALLPSATSPSVHDAPRPAQLQRRAASKFQIWYANRHGCLYGTVPATIPVLGKPPAQRILPTSTQTGALVLLCCAVLGYGHRRQRAATCAVAGWGKRKEPWMRALEISEDQKQFIAEMKKIKEEHKAAAGTKSRGLLGFFADRSPGRTSPSAVNYEDFPYATYYGLSVDKPRD